MSYFPKPSGAPLYALTFHGVISDLPDYSVHQSTRDCHILIPDFVKILESCAKKFTFIRLNDLTTYLDGKADKPGILLTFDDGLASVTEQAAPILRQFSASAVLFVNTAWIDYGKSPAIFELEREIWNRAPVRVGIEALGFKVELDINDRRSIDSSLVFIWQALMLKKIAPVSLKRENIFFDDYNWSTMTTSHNDRLWAPTTWDKLRFHVDNGVLEIGSHGESHSPWPWLTEVQLKKELESSKERLQRELQIEVNTCSYPHGMTNPQSQELVIKSYLAAFGIRGDKISENAIKSHLPRYHVPAQIPNGLPWIISRKISGRIIRKAYPLLSSFPRTR